MHYVLLKIDPIDVCMSRLRISYPTCCEQCGVILEFQSGKSLLLQTMTVVSQRAA